MKKIISCILTVILMFSALTFSVNAASGVDVVDTFESYYTVKDLIGGIYKGEGNLTGNISTDTKTSAPNRGDGKSNGNYRSLKATFKFDKDEWGSVRNRVEDNYVLVDPINKNENVNFTFYAKADKAMTIVAEVDIKDCPFYASVNLTTEWKKYTLNLRDLEPELNDKNGNNTKIYERNAAKAWGSGVEEAFLVGFKFQILKTDNPNISSGTFWLDTFAFEGATINEVTEAQGWGTEYDEPGSVPKDFVADTGSNTNSSSDSTPSNSTSSNNTPSNNTPSNSTSSDDSSSNKPTSSSSDVTSNDQSDKTQDNSSEGDLSTDEKSDETKSDTLIDNDKKGATDTWFIILLVVVASVVLICGGFTIYYLTIIKKKSSADDNVDENK